MRTAEKWPVASGQWPASHNTSRFKNPEPWFVGRFSGHWPLATDHRINHASPESRPQIQTITRASPDAPAQPGHRAPRARQDQDHAPQGQGGSALRGEADHPGQGRLEPEQLPPLPGGADQQAGHVQALPRDRAAVQEPAGRLHPHLQACQGPPGRRRRHGRDQPPGRARADQGADSPGRRLLTELHARP